MASNKQERIRTRTKSTAPSRAQALLGVCFIALAAISACRRESSETASDRPEESESASNPATQALTEKETSDNTAASPEPQTSVNRTAAVQPANASAEPVRKTRRRVDPLEGLEAELLAKWNGLRSVRLNMKTFLVGTEYPAVKQEGEGTRECLKTDGNIRIRTELVTAVQIEVNEEDIQSKQTWIYKLKVFDGEFLYTQTTDHVGVKAIKQTPTPDSLLAIGGPGLIAALRKIVKFHRKPDQVFKGRPCYVFGGYQSKGTTVEYFVDKETGLLHVLKREARDGSITQRLELSDYELNPDFPEGHFSYTPPDGLYVEDLTSPGTIPPLRPPGS